MRWLRFEEPPEDVARLLLVVVAEDAIAAQDFARREIEPRLVRREPVVLDFSNVRVCTAGFLHALLHESVRLAWALAVPLYVVQVDPTVQAQLEFLEGYSLVG